MPKPQWLDNVIRWIRADAPETEPLLWLEGAERIDFQIDAAAGDGSEKAATFSGVAYTGGAMQLNGYYLPVVVDLGGLKAAGDMPALLEHDRGRIVGHHRAEVSAKDIRVTGTVSGGGMAAREVIASARKGFPWKLSIGAAGEMERVLAGETVIVNGRSFRGPLYVLRKGTLREVSFTPIGADARTSVRVAATQQEIDTMTFEQWLQANGFAADTLTDKQRSTLEATYNAEVKAAAPPADPPAAPPPLPTPQPAATPPLGEVHAAGATHGPDVQELVNQAVSRAVEQVTGQIEARARIDDLTREHPEIRAQAHRDHWDATRTELEILRHQRSGGPAIHVAEGLSSARVLEAAAVMACSAGDEQSWLKAYGEQTLEAAGRYRRMGLKDLIRACCQLEGRPAFGVGASEREIVASGFSTVTLPGILSNLAHKSLMAAYQAVPSAADILAAKLTASDFKTHTAHELGADMDFEEVGPDGELKHGKLSEDSHTFRVATYGKLFGITRVMLKNDDMNAFTRIPQLMGRGAASKRESLFWTLVLANASAFFHDNNSNLITDALDSAGLGAAVVKLKKQTDLDGKPVLLDAKYVVVPPELRVDADELYLATSINTGGSSTKTKQPNRNIWANRYLPVDSPYISNSSFTGHSTTQWYLWGDPADVPAYGIAYLDGVDSPTVEDAGTAPDVLGQAYRAYIDMGVAELNHRGAVKSTGGG
jgi:hypothetical protein